MKIVYIDGELQFLEYAKQVFKDAHVSVTCLLNAPSKRDILTVYKDTDLLIIDVRSISPDLFDEFPAKEKVATGSHESLFFTEYSAEQLHCNYFWKRLFLFKNLSTILKQETEEENGV